MSYLSIKFIVFLLIILTTYYLVTKKLRPKILLVSSLVFYLSFGIKYILFLLFTAITTFMVAKNLEKFKNKKLIFVLCIIANVLIWSIIKVMPWGINISNSLFERIGINYNISYFSIIAPIGISYYLLQSLSYLIDVYKSKVKPEKKFWKYLLFLTYFPAIVQGPISRYSELISKLNNKKKYSFYAIRSGLILALFGLVKKIVIADRIGIFVNYCFDNYSDLSGIILYLGAISYSIQIYMDFSGCVDICRGISGLFGIELPKNFNCPYFSKSIKEFWQRWHITLSRWLKDYIYIPLGGNRKGIKRKYLNLLITFIVSGIWHGAGFSFLFWGFLHAIYQIFGELTINIRKKIKKIIKVEENTFSDKLYKIIITFNLVTFAWIFFRATSFMSGVEYIKNMFSVLNIHVLFDGTIFTYGINQNMFNLLILEILIILFVENKFFKQEKIVNWITNTHIIIRWSIYLILIFNILIFGVYGSGYDITDFMYGGF